MHFKKQDGVAAHCLRLQLGSLADPRLNQRCTHKHPKPKLSPAQEVRDEQQNLSLVRAQSWLKVQECLGSLLGCSERVALSSTCTKSRSQWQGHNWPETKVNIYGDSHPPIEPKFSPTCCDTECKGRSTADCQHCVISFCRQHLEEHLCNSECLPKRSGRKFICRWVTCM